MLNGKTLEGNLKYIEIGCLVTLIVIASFLFATEKGWLDAEDKVAVSSTEAVESKIDYSPSTAEDQKVSENVKQEVDSGESIVIDQELKASLTRATFKDDQLELGALVTDGGFDGTCVFTLTDGNISKETSTKSLKSNGSAGCSAKIDASTMSKTDSWEVGVYALREDGTKSVTDTASISASDR